MKKIIFFNLLLACAGLLVSCEKNDVEGMTEMPEKAKLVFVNAAPNASTVAAVASREIGIYPFYNGVQFNNFPIKFPWSNGYKAFDPGTITIRLDTAHSQGNNPPGPAARVMEFPLQLEANSYYSLYAVGTAHNVDTFFVKDDLSVPSTGKAKILFLNLSSDAGPLDIVNATTNTVVAANLGYKQRRAYIEVDPGTLRFQINAAGTTTVLRAARDLIIDAGAVYTVWARGLRTIPVPGATAADHPLQLSYHANRWIY